MFYWHHLKHLYTGISGYIPPYQVLPSITPVYYFKIDASSLYGRFYVGQWNPDFTCYKSPYWKPIYIILIFLPFQIKNRFH